MYKKLFKTFTSSLTLLGVISQVHGTGPCPEDVSISYVYPNNPNTVWDSGREKEWVVEYVDHTNEYETGLVYGQVVVNATSQSNAVDQFENYLGNN